MPQSIWSFSSTRFPRQLPSLELDLSARSKIFTTSEASIWKTLAIWSVGIPIMPQEVNGTVDGNQKSGETTMLRERLVVEIYHFFFTGFDILYPRWLAFGISEPSTVWKVWCCYSSYLISPLPTQRLTGRMLLCRCNPEIYYSQKEMM